MLDDLRRRPLDQTVYRRFCLAMGDIPEAAIERHKNTVPQWIGKNLLAETINNAFQQAVFDLPETIGWNDVADYLESQIEAAMAKLSEHIPGERFASERIPKLGSRFGNDFAVDPEVGVEIADNDEMTINLRTQIEKNESEFIAACEVCRSAKMKTALAMLWMGASLSAVRDATRLTGPEIVRQYLGLLAKVRRAA